MTTKVCTGCLQEKDIEEFSWSIHGIKRHPRCKVCRSQERSERYERNKDAEPAYKWERQQRKRKEASAFVEEYKSSHPCMDCGNDDTMVPSLSWQKIQWRLESEACHLP